MIGIFRITSRKIVSQTTTRVYAMAPAARKGLAPAASTGALDADHVARLQLARRLRRKLFPVQQRPAFCARLSPRRSCGAARAALGQERQPAVLEHTQLADDAVAAAVLPGPARAFAQLVALDAQ